MVEITADLTTLTSAELDELYEVIIEKQDAILAERRRRAELNQEEAKIAEAVVSLQDRGVLVRPQAVTLDAAKELGIDELPVFEDPGTDQTKMYRYGDVVQNGGRAWLNEVKDRLNGWVPGAAGVYENVWHDVTALVNQSAVTVKDGSLEHPFTWKTGLVLKKGQFVTYEGVLYELAQDHTSTDYWRPGPGLESIYTLVA
ncbi:hypothetical protein QVA66_09185 [Staphylococcus chromogenes]|nr:hypothetical protein [Staphylococcus chromogenes]